MSPVLFVHFIPRTTVAAALDNARLLGRGFAFLILLSALMHGLRTIAWRICLDGDGGPGLLSLFRLRLVGEAFNDLPPAGPLLGESVKTWAASRHMPGTSSASSVILENLIYSLAALPFILIGLALALFAFVVPVSSRWFTGGLASSLVLFLLAAYALVHRRILLITRMLDQLEGRKPKLAFLEWYAKYVRVVEGSARDFFLTRPGLFFSVLAIEFVINFTGVGEGYLILKATTGHASLLVAYLFESASRGVRLAFTVLPFCLGCSRRGGRGHGQRFRLCRKRGSFARAHSQRVSRFLGRCGPVAHAPILKR